MLKIEHHIDRVHGAFPKADLNVSVKEDAFAILKNRGGELMILIKPKP